MEPSPPNDPEVPDAGETSERNMALVKTSTGKQNQMKNVVDMFLNRGNLDKFNRYGHNLRKFSKSNNKTKTPATDELEDIQNFLKETNQQKRVIYDRCRFNACDYQAKKIELSNKIKEIIDSIWIQTPSQADRQEFGNFVNFIITFSVMFEWMNEVMAIEYERGKYSFMSCELIDLVDNYFETVKMCQQKGSVGMENFTFILTFRDKIVEALRDHFNSNGLRKIRKRGFFLPELNDRYTPFDYEWLGAACISGEYQLPFVKFLAINRMAQIDISYNRALIIATKNDTEAKKMRKIRIPFPRNVENPILLAQGLRASEGRLRTDFCHLFKALRADCGVTTDMSFMLRIEQFNEICGNVRIRKRTTLMQLIHCDSHDILTKFRVIAIMSTLDCWLLILQKVYALFVDEERGIYGEAVPTSLLASIHRLYLAATDENCRQQPLHRKLSKMLDKLRTEVRIAVREFFTRKEVTCYSYYHEPIVDDSPPTPYLFDFEISERDFPSEILQHASKMIWHLQEQQKELFRLNKEVHQTRLAPDVWPEHSGIPPFIINTALGCTSFCSNFHIFVPRQIVRDIMGLAADDWVIPTPEAEVGFDMISSAAAIMGKHRAVPHCVEIRAAFEAEFAAEIGTQKIEGRTYKQLAAQFSYILNHEIDITNARIKWQSRINTTTVALKIARRMVRKYLDYACVYARMPPKRLRTRSPSPLQVNEAVRSLNNGDDESEDSDDAESVASSDSGTDYEAGSNLIRHMTREGAAQMAMLLNALTMDAVSNVIFVESNTPIDENTGEVPDHVIEEFLRNFRCVDFGLIYSVDMSARHLNMPLD